MDWQARLYLQVDGLLRAEDGQDLAEYMLLVALIAVGVIGSITLLGSGVHNFLIHTVLVIERATGVATGFLG